MAVKPKLSVKSKTSSKHKAAVKPNKKISSRQSDFSHLAEDIISNISVGIYIVQKGNFVYVSPLFQKLSGYSYADLAGTNPVDYIHPDDREVVRKKAIKSLKGKSSDAYEYRFTRKNGEVMWILEMVTSITYKGELAALGSFMDITERKKIEEAIHQSEERYRNILESIQEGYFELDLAGNYTFANGANGRFLGYTKEELVGMNFRQHTDEENAKKLYQPYRELYRTGKPIETLEVESIRKDGTKVIYETSVSLIRDSEGKPIGFRGVSRDATDRNKMEEALRQSEERYRTILDEMEDGYFEVDLAGNYLFVNDANCRNIGYTREELIGTTFRGQMAKEEYDKVYKAFSNIYITGKPERGIAYKAIRKDGITGTGEIAGFPLKNKKGEVIGFRGMARDITERKQMEEALRQSEERYRTIIEEMEEWYFETDLAGNITFSNDVFANVLRYSQKELTGLNFRSFIKKEESDSVYRLFNQVFKTGESTKNFPYEFISTDGIVISAEFSIFPKRDKEGKVCGFKGIGHDITARKRMEEEIQYQATHDALTGLPNRLMFSQLLNHAIQSAKRYQRQFAVFFIDLDRFKTINDTLGHEAGDQLLQEIAMRLKQTLRTVDVVARLGGDEFVILIEELSDLSQVETVAGKILSAVIKPVNLMNEECRITASIGISVFPKDAEDEQSLLKNADIAMYLAKEEGKNNYQFYSEDIQSKSLEHLSIETNLRFALERNELSLHYQAKLDFKTNAITGVEALLRWQNPSLGSVTPTQFIPVAEESGLIIPIGRWILRTACAQNAAWQQQGLPPVCMAVNLSLRQLTDNNLIDDIRTALNDSGMAPNLLELEITESMVMHNPTRMIAVLAKIKNLGVRLAIDDFGTGYSSLAQIKHFPIDTLKVDRSFIRNIPQDAEDKAVTEAIIAMGKALSLTVVAEGVETVEHMNFLNDHSCDEMQGFYFSKPIAPEQFADLLRKHVPSPGK